VNALIESGTLLKFSFFINEWFRFCAMLI